MDRVLALTAFAAFVAVFMARRSLVLGYPDHLCIMISGKYYIHIPGAVAVKHIASLHVLLCVRLLLTLLQAQFLCMLLFWLYVWSSLMQLLLPGQLLI